MPDISDVADRVTLGADGIWRGAGHEAISYPAAGNDTCFQIEESSFWFNHRNACIVAAVRNYPPRGDQPIVDVGGGNGFVSMGLIKAGFQAILVEPGPRGASNAKQRGVPTVVCATTESAGFRPATLECIGLFDVIEHNSHDLQFLQSMRRLLKPGGLMYATVPAYSWLWSAEDEQAGHFRRYTRGSLRALAERADFVVEYSTYIFRFLPLPILAMRTLPYRLGLSGNSPAAPDPSRDHRPPSGLAARLMNQMFRLEVTNIERKHAMAFGGSCLLVARAV